MKAHVLLNRFLNRYVSQATAFAVMLGFAEEALETDVSNALHDQWRAAACQVRSIRLNPEL
jgi:hypothetical protein